MPFSQKTLDFLSENRFRDNKEWFESHRKEYNELVLNPMKELVLGLAPTIYEIDDALICEPKMNGSISRIYRDTRFSLDKSLFREVQWCSFIRHKGLYHGWPAFFFEFSPYSMRYGCGYYEASPKAMECVRTLILEQDKAFTRALKSYNSQKVFALDGAKYKRSRYPQQPEEIKNWLDRKSLCMIHSNDNFELLFSEELTEAIADAFMSLKPFYELLIKAEMMKDEI